MQKKSNRIKALFPQRVKNVLHIFVYRKKKRDTLKFTIDLVKHCNLKCKGCDHFSCIADEKYADFNSVTRDLYRIKEIFGNRVEQIALLGGEPLLNNRIEDYCELARKTFPNTKIIIITNGTLVLKKEEGFWECCRKHNIVIRITRYPIKFDYEKVESYIKAKGIKLEHMAESDKVVKSMYCLPIDLQGRQNPKMSFMMCSKGNDCITLENGRLYTCTIIPNIYIFNKTFKKDLKICKEDYIDIYECGNADEILVRLTKPVPFCKYCDNYNYRSGIPWDVTRGQIDEWT